MHNLGQWHRFVEMSTMGRDGMPQNPVWNEQILRDSYLVFYDLFVTQSETTAQTAQARR